MLDTNIPYLINKESIVESQYYESSNQNNNFLLTPEIESDIIESKYVKIYIPVFKNERKMRDEFCGVFETDDNNSRSVRRKNQREHTLECYHKYNRIYVNEKPITVNFMRYTHHRTNQFGIIAYIDSDHIDQGKNTLEIKKEFQGDNAQDWKIPFYFVSKTD